MGVCCPLFSCPSTGREAGVIVRRTGPVALAALRPGLSFLVALAPKPDPDGDAAGTIATAPFCFATEIAGRRRNVQIPRDDFYYHRHSSRPASSRAFRTSAQRRIKRNAASRSARLPSWKTVLNPTTINI